VSGQAPYDGVCDRCFARTVGASNNVTALPGSKTKVSGGSEVRPDMQSSEPMRDNLDQLPVRPDRSVVGGIVSHGRRGSDHVGDRFDFGSGKVSRPFSMVAAIPVQDRPRVV
jgi:hypothetical protein